ncbi:cation:proton antiporter domain-containing protein [Thiohalophilus thiocyanatoxydans]|uniref:cation:proton antiporter domain-containing protein n=1 Tax=Thiohalophilus thiocyanatoxydans TaxID=381308 RepID=UPI001417073C|nr:cation:proton antiporter [Thiohalophilus thiocyanatoxydans]
MIGRIARQSADHETDCPVSGRIAVFTGQAHYPLPCHICGALICATDPAAVIDIFKHFRIDERLITLLEGESLFNDAIAIVLFGLLLSLVIKPAQQRARHLPVVSFLYGLLGGIITRLSNPGTVTAA